MRRQGGKGGRIVRWHGRRGGKGVMRWQLVKGGRVMSREGGMEFKSKTVFIAPGKRNVSRDLIIVI